MDYEFMPVPDDWIDVDHPHLRIGHDGSLQPVDGFYDPGQYDASPGGPDWNPEDDWRETEAHAERDANKQFDYFTENLGMNEQQSASALIEYRETIWGEYVAAGEATVEYGRAFDKMVVKINRLYNLDENIPKTVEADYYFRQRGDGNGEPSTLSNVKKEITDSVSSDEKSDTQESISGEDLNGGEIDVTDDWEEEVYFDDDSSQRNWDNVFLGGLFSFPGFDLVWLSDGKIDLLREALVLPEGNIDLQRVMEDGLDVPTIPEWVAKWKDSAFDAESALVMHMKGSVPR